MGVDIAAPTHNVYSSIGCKVIMNLYAIPMSRPCFAGNAKMFKHGIEMVAILLSGSEHAILIEGCSVSFTFFFQWVPGTCCILYEL